MPRINYKKITPDAQEPTIAHSTDINVGWDLYADHNALLYPLTPTKIGTGIAIEMEQDDSDTHNLAGFVFPRSGMALKGITLANSVGVIDPGYRGEIIIPLILIADIFNVAPIEIKKGDRIAQLVFMRTAIVSWSEILMLGQTERGTDGFGSTGR